eukprot:1109404-Pleurochrysis_carterae.AAC.1
MAKSNVCAALWAAYLGHMFRYFPCMQLKRFLTFCEIAKGLLAISERLNLLCSQADEFLAAPAKSLLKATSRQDWRRLQRQLIPARRALMYRSFSSSVAARSLSEAWATCLRDNQTHARHFTTVAKC